MQALGANFRRRLRLQRLPMVCDVPLVEHPAAADPLMRIVFDSKRMHIASDPHS